MKRSFRFLLFSVFVCKVFFIESGCGGGDSEPPGDINDLCFFTDPDALVFDEKVTILPEKFPPRTVSLAWTSTGDNGEKGEASLYDFRYITEDEVIRRGIKSQDICDEDNDYLHKIQDEPYPKKSGQLEIQDLLSLGFQRFKSYYFCLWALDEIGQRNSPAMIKTPFLPLLGIPLETKEGKSEGVGSSLSNSSDMNANNWKEFAVGNPELRQVLIYETRNWHKLFQRKNVEHAEITEVIDGLKPTLVIEGSTVEGFGGSVSFVGKIAKKAGSELAVGAPLASHSIGRVYIFYGKAGQDELWGLDEADVILEGEHTGGEFGKEIAFCDDLNKDGVSDFAVSAPGGNRVYVVLGGNESSPRGPLSSGNIADISALIIYGEGSQDRFGESLSCGADFNGDGISDLAIGAPKNKNKGAVYVFYGGNAGIAKFISELSLPGKTKKIDLLLGDKADITIRGIEEDGEFGRKVAFSGEFLGVTGLSSLSDLAVGAPGIENGVIAIFYGGGFGKIDIASVPFSATYGHSDFYIFSEGEERIGSKFSGGGDFNRDGKNDIVSLDENSGKVRIYFLSSNQQSYLMEGGFGFTSVSVLSDIDVDGLPEVLGGMSEEGRAWLFK